MSDNARENIPSNCQHPNLLSKIATPPSRVPAPSIFFLQWDSPCTEPALAPICLRVQSKPSIIPPLPLQRVSVSTPSRLRLASLSYCAGLVLVPAS